MRCNRNAVTARLGDACETDLSGYFPQDLQGQILERPIRARGHAGSRCSRESARAASIRALIGAKFSTFCLTSSSRAHSSSRARVRVISVCRRRANRRDRRSSRARRREVSAIRRNLVVSHESARSAFFARSSSRARTKRVAPSWKDHSCGTHLDSFPLISTHFYSFLTPLHSCSLIFARSNRLRRLPGAWL